MNPSVVVNRARDSGKVSLSNVLEEGDVSPVEEGAVLRFVDRPSRWVEYQLQTRTTDTRHPQKGWKVRFANDAPVMLSIRDGTGCSREGIINEHGEKAGGEDI